jgi:succinate-semialdehyde dehydrogenase/glutarate-semialdehyde dehydrogenase
MNHLVSTNPAENYAYIGEVPISTPAEVSEKVVAAQQAKLGWKELGLDGRTALLEPICAEFNDRVEEIASLVSQEVGKPIEEARGEAHGYANQLYSFMAQAGVLRDSSTSLDTDPFNHRKVYEPRGATAVITPWNFPFGMAMWGIMPNLIAGNTVVFKTSEECPLTGKLIEDVFANHDLPDGVFSEVYGDGEVGEALVKDDVDFIWFTGSNRAGRAINQIAAERFIQPVLEMGGSNPCIVFEDADIDQTAERILQGRFQNNGQVCDAIKRLIVHESIMGKLLEGMVAGLHGMRIGDPSDPNNQLGSLVAERQVILLKEQVKEAALSGAQIIGSVRVPANLKGAYHPAHILANVTTDMRVWKEEVFGPVLPVVSFRTEAEAVRLANDTTYGLGALVVSSDTTRAERVASQIEAGTVDINQGDHWLNDWNPFGGYKQSGIGREHGLEGMQALCQIKVIAR